ncbi:MAG TPA: carbon starvation protein A [Vicinamibacterales bacterium]|nr:carbon starvation protein A [Vicinamibacterales bacterium]
MHALYVLLPALGILAIAYRYYSAFIATKVWMLDDARKTPAHTKYDGANFYPTTKWVMFGHHFAAITGAGPLVGPMLAAQFGYAPGFIWLVAGCCLAGAVHDSMILWASTRRGGKSLPDIVKQEISPTIGFVAAITIILILVVALAGLGVAFVNALADSVWGTFTVAMTIPLGIFMGFWMYVWRKGKITEATILGVAGLLLALWAGEPISHSDSWFASLFHLSRNQIVVALGIYGFAASMLPVWLLLSPRGYLSSFTKIGTIFLLAIGVIIVNPELQMPALSEFAGGGGPIIPGPLFPFCFITIACGAISGFHALISSGTTPKMIDKESDIRPVGYGAMLIEGVVGIMALIAAASMAPGDYFAINTPPAVYQNLTFQGVDLEPVNVHNVEAAVGETVVGRTGGAVSLAVGMAQIFASLPGMQGLLAYWYHFAIMFEALFILTTIDSGTRVGRFLLQEFMGRAYKPLADHNNIFAGSLATLIMVFSWGYFIYTGQINTIWPMFAVGNQLLAAVALAVATSILINLGRTKYIWVTLLPLSFLSVNTLYGGFLNIRDNYYPLAVGANAARNMEGWILTVCTAVMIVLAVVILGAAVQKWLSVLNGGPVPATAERG